MVLELLRNVTAFKATLTQYICEILTHSNFSNHSLSHSEKKDGESVLQQVIEHIALSQCLCRIIIILQ